LPYDDAKVQKILTLTVPPVKKAAAAPIKKDFRSFIKQQKDQAEKEVKDGELE
jgi:hypothetical protein